MPVTSLTISVAGEDFEESDWLARQFRLELLNLDVETVTFATAACVPAEAKGDPVTTGTIIVTLANSAVLTSIFQLARAWATRDRGRKIVIKNGDKSIEIDGADSKQHQRLIEALLENDMLTKKEAPGTVPPQPHAGAQDVATKNS